MTTGILKARFAIMRSVHSVAKDRRNEYHKYMYSGHDDVTDALRPAMLEHGVLQSVSVLEANRVGDVLMMKVRVTWMCVEDGTSEFVDALGEACGKATAVQAGQAVSYAVKVAQLKCFMLDGGAPDPEAGHGDDERKPGNGGRPQPVAPRVDVTDKQVELLLGQYEELKSSLELSNLRRSISSLVSGLTDEQHGKLEAADREAAQRVGKV